VRCPRDGTPLTTVAPLGLSQLVGRVVDERYRVLSQLGEGGMGVVFRGVHSFTQRPVAIKVLRAEFSSETDAVARFMQEAQSASRIGHENIIEIYDAGVLPSGEPYFAMELLEGKSLSEVVKRGPMVIERAIEVGAQICKGLAAAHRVGIVHRDIKPENIFLSPRPDGIELVKILDFGIAKILDQESNLTKAGAILGTPHYMSPEQSSGSVADARSDIYAVGVLLYEMLTGQPPFTGSTMMAILSKQMLDDPISPNKVRPGGGVWPALENVVLRALKKIPEHRFQTMDEMEQALNSLLGNAQSFSPMTVKAGLPQPKQKEISALGGQGDGITGLTSAMALIQTAQQKQLGKNNRAITHDDVPTEAGGPLNLPLPASIPTGGRAVVPQRSPQQTNSRVEPKPELPMPVGMGHSSGKLVRMTATPEPSRAEPPKVPQPALSESSSQTTVSNPQTARPKTPPSMPVTAPPKAPPTRVSNQSSPVVPSAMPPRAPTNEPPQVASMPIASPRKDPSGAEFSWGEQVVGATGDAWGDVSSRGSMSAVSRPVADAADTKRRMLIIGLGCGLGATVLIVLVYMIAFYNPTPLPSLPPVANNNIPTTVITPPTTLVVADTIPTTIASVDPNLTTPNPKSDVKTDPKNDPKNNKTDPKNDPKNNKNNKTDPKNDPKTDPKPKVDPEVKSFKMMSNPSGAQVFINGAPIGNTPLQLNSEPGARSAVIKKDGYKSVTRSIPANNSSLIVVTLDPVEAEGDPKPDLKDPGQ
jgi:serine/threonine protein kinase